MIGDDNEPGPCSQEWRILIDATLKSDMMRDVWIDGIGWRKALSKLPPFLFGKLPAGKPQTQPNPTTTQRPILDGRTAARNRA